MRVHSNTRTRTSAHAHAHTHTYTHSHTCKKIHTHERKCIHMFMYTHVHTFTHTDARLWWKDICACTHEQAMSSFLTFHFNPTQMVSGSTPANCEQPVWQRVEESSKSSTHGWPANFLRKAFPGTTGDVWQLHTWIWSSYSSQVWQCPSEGCTVVGRQGTKWARYESVWF